MTNEADYHYNEYKGRKEEEVLDNKEKEVYTSIDDKYNKELNKEEEE